jgi:hypothetical protein
MPEITTPMLAAYAMKLKSYDPENVLGAKKDETAFMQAALDTELQKLGMNLQSFNKYALVELGAAQTGSYGRETLISHALADLRNPVKKDDMTHARGNISHFFAANKHKFPDNFYAGYDPNVTREKVASRVGLLDMLAGPWVMHYPISRTQLRENMIPMTLDSYDEVREHVHGIVEQNKLPVIFSHHLLDKEKVDLSTYKPDKMGKKEFQSLEKSIPLHTLPGLHIHLVNRTAYNTFIKQTNEKTDVRFKRTFLEPVSGSNKNTDPFKSSLQSLYACPPVTSYRRVNQLQSSVTLMFAWNNS